MDAKAQELLSRFAEHANRGVIHANDWEMFDEFVGYVYGSNQAVTPEVIVEILKEHGWEEDQAERVALAYSHQVRILAKVKP